MIGTSVTSPYSRGAVGLARSDAQNRRLLAGWLFVVAGMILGMVVLGGATRLTGSGLSIMRWDPIMGAIPPLSHAAWEHLFALYKEIPQYSAEHQGFGLTGFQHIFWLEWVHRFWGRLIGIVVIVPLVIFWWQHRLTRALSFRLLLLFLLGAVQGLIGWLMVATGFRPDSTAVAAPWLVFHLCFALFLYALILWTALSLLQPEPAAFPGGGVLRALALASLILLSITIAAGGLVAGTHAGFIYNTFPLMEGHLVPANYAGLHPFLANLVQNRAAVQFDHRLLATLTLALLLATAALGLVKRPPRPVRYAFAILGVVVLVQYTLGVETLLNVVPIPLGVAHQFTAALVLTAVLVALHSVRGGERARMIASGGARVRRLLPSGPEAMFASEPQTTREGDGR